MNDTPAPLMLSVSGARGIVGKTMTPTVAAEFAAAYGSIVKQSARDPGCPLVCVGRDSRPSGAMLAAAATSGLAAVGCRVVDLGLVATPTAGVMVEHRGADAGVVITASHNPIQWNGLKCLDATGGAPAAGAASAIIEAFREKRIDYAAVEDLHAIEVDGTGHEVHVGRVLEHIDATPVRNAGFTVVLDSVNGAGGVAGRMLLERLGCTVVQVNGEPSGRFAHPPEPLAANLTDLAARTASAGATCGFAQDPDADRLAIVDETGRYIGEEYTLVLAARRLLETRGAGTMATNLSTSRMIDDLAAAHAGAAVIRAAVGEANVAAAMRESNALVGGEGNGGVIYPPVGWVRDSLSAMALVLGLIAETGEPLSAIVDSMPRYAIVKQTVDLTRVGGRAAVDAAVDRVASRFADGRIDTADGVRLDIDDAWVHLRPSNTEPIARIIAEAPTAEQARELIGEVLIAAGWCR